MKQNTNEPNANKNTGTLILLNNANPDFATYKMCDDNRQLKTGHSQSAPINKPTRNKAGKKYPTKQK